MTKGTFQKCVEIGALLVTFPLAVYVFKNCSALTQLLFSVAIVVIALVFRKLIYEPIRKTLPD